MKKLLMVVFVLITIVIPVFVKADDTIKDLGKYKHKVVRGECPWTIVEKRYGYADSLIVAELMKKNGITDPYNVQVGTILLLNKTRVNRKEKIIAAYVKPYQKTIENLILEQGIKNAKLENKGLKIQELENQLAEEKNKTKIPGYFILVFVMIILATLGSSIMARMAIKKLAWYKKELTGKSLTVTEAIKKRDMAEAIQEEISKQRKILEVEIAKLTNALVSKTAELKTLEEKFAHVETEKSAAIMKAKTERFEELQEAQNKLLREFHRAHNENETLVNTMEGLNKTIETLGKTIEASETTNKKLQDDMAVLQRTIKEFEEKLQWFNERKPGNTIVKKIGNDLFPGIVVGWHLDDWYKKQLSAAGIYSEELILACAQCKTIVPSNAHLALHWTEGHGEEERKTFLEGLNSNKGEINEKINFNSGPSA